MEAKSKTEVAVFGGGCFWCTEAIFAQLNGVISAMPGYAGGHVIDPSYEEVSTGKTGHVEVTRIEFDPTMVTYTDLLTVFFATHDPTTLDRQGNDIGSQYRSTIFFANEGQREQAKIYIDSIRDMYDRSIVTEMRPLDAFYVAEDYHRRYYEQHKDAPYCRAIIGPKLEKLQKEFADLLVSHKKDASMKKDDEISPELYHIAREGGTEAPFTGTYWNMHEKGMYRCAICGAELFSSETKFDSGTGWPSFSEPLNLEHIELREDRSMGMRRTEVVCKACGAHLGHMFDDGPRERGGKRYCINSICLKLEKKKD